jgi:hypothetical protein
VRVPSHFKRSVQNCTAVENTFVESVTFDIALFLGLGLDMRSLQIKLYSYKNNLAIDMTRHKAHLVYYFVPLTIYRNEKGYENNLWVLNRSAPHVSRRFVRLALKRK